MQSTFAAGVDHRNANIAYYLSAVHCISLDGHAGLHVRTLCMTRKAQPLMAVP